MPTTETKRPMMMDTTVPTFALAVGLIGGWTSHFHKAPSRAEVERAATCLMTFVGDKTLVFYREIGDTDYSEANANEFDLFGALSGEAL